MNTHCEATEAQNGQIPEIENIMPSITQYKENIKDVLTRYTDVYKRADVIEEKARIENAKYKVINFYCDIFSVKPEDIKAYDEKFSINEYLA